MGENGYSGQDDELLMRRVQEHDSGALRELYVRYSGRLKYYFLRMMDNDSEKARDLLQEVFLKLLERPELYNPELPFRTWLFSIAHNMCKNEYRRRSVRRSSAEAVRERLYPATAEEDEVEKQLDRSILRREISRELRTLSPDMRSTFLMRYQENFNIRDISRMIGIPEGTVKSRLFNITSNLIEKLRNA